MYPLRSKKHACCWGTIHIVELLSCYLPPATMLGHIKPKDADYNRQNLLHMSRVYNDLDRSSHRSLSSPQENFVEMQEAIRPKGKVPNIAIIGAGISGLRCADVLINSGARVTIYEARDRIGGRVCEERTLLQDQKLMHPRYIKWYREVI